MGGNHFVDCGRIDYPYVDPAPRGEQRPWNVELKIEGSLVFLGIFYERRDVVDRCQHAVLGR